MTTESAKTTRPLANADWLTQDQIDRIERAGQWCGLVLLDLAEDSILDWARREAISLDWIMTGESQIQEAFAEWRRLSIIQSDTDSDLDSMPEHDRKMEQALGRIARVPAETLADLAAKVAVTFDPVSMWVPSYLPLVSLHRDLRGMFGDYNPVAATNWKEAEMCALAALDADRTSTDEPPMWA